MPEVSSEDRNHHMTIKEILEKGKVLYYEQDDQIVTHCPFKAHLDAEGNPLSYFHLNPETLIGECYECKARKPIDEAYEAFGIDWKAAEKQTAPLPKANEKAPFQRLVVLPVADLISEAPIEIDWIIPKILPAEGIVVFSGLAGSGKTWLAMAIAKAVSEGSKLFGEFDAKQLPVLYIDQENNRNTIVRRIRKLGIKPSPMFWLIDQSLRLDKKDDIERLKLICKEKKIKLVILDSFVRFHGGNENESSATAALFEEIKVLRREGISVLFLHHHRKESFSSSSSVGNSLRGSSDILAAVDCHIAIRKEGDTLFLTQSKLRQDQEIPPFKVKLEEAGEGNEARTSFSYLGEDDARERKLAEIAEVIPELIRTNGQMSRQDIIDAAKKLGTSSMIDEVLKKLAADGVLKMTVGARNKHSYVLVEQIPT